VQGFAPVASAGAAEVVGFGAVTVQGYAPTVIVGVVSSRRHATPAESANSGTIPDANGGALARTANGGTLSRG